MSRNWDIYSIEKRVYELEKNGGGSPSPTPSSGDVYSTDETEIGTFLGEKLYRKVLTGSLSAITADTGTVIADLTSLNVKTLVKAIVLLEASSGQTWGIATNFGSMWTDSSNKLKCEVPTGYSSISSSKIIVEYTKVASDAKSTKRSKKA